jgi:hypothetical protein
MAAVEGFVRGSKEHRELRDALNSLAVLKKML